MTQDEIIELARQAGVRDDEHIFEFSQYKYLEAFAKLVAEKEREACAKICDLAMLQNQEAINELENDEHIAKCFIQGAMNQLVKTAKAIRAKG
jgi:DNA-directed RNA polymerase subunit F